MHAPRRAADNPSLHLNLAADHVKVGRREAARVHVRRARGAADALGDDRYGDGVRAEISRLESRLDSRPGEEDDSGGDLGQGPGGGSGGGSGGRSSGPPRQRP